MKTVIYIENLKCYGCANTIRRNILKETDVKDVLIDHENPSVTIEYKGSTDKRDLFLSILSKLGYPEKGHNSTGSAVKSYVSCAIGRVKK